MKALTKTRRIEWRGDLFASDLASFMGRLQQSRFIPYDLPHTLTVFLQPEREDLNVEKTLRLRCYCELPEFSPEAVVEIIRREIHGKLQLKERSGNVTEIARGAAALISEPALLSSESLWKIKLAGQLYRATSVRVARRSHFELDAPGEIVRITVDRQRLLFRLGKGSPRFLGDMGPRVEIKGTTREGTNAAQAAVNSDGLLRRLPYHSLELLFQDQLRHLIDPDSLRGFPEIESKFEISARNFTALAGRMERWIGNMKDTRMLLPFPHRIVRMRRYHFCEAGQDGEERVAVETTAGRLSAKTKINPFATGPVLVRKTKASRTTDIDGAQQTPEAFLRDRAWTAINRVDKVQTKIPFRLGNGNCYQLSMDDCLDVFNRRLKQAELEYIGSVQGQPEPSDTYSELSLLSESLPLRSSLLSKFDFFARKAPVISSSRA